MSEKLVPTEADRERAVMVCPQCDGEGGYPDGLDDAACHTECTRCGGNGWIVDLRAFAVTELPVDMLRALPDGKVDDSSFEAIEEALDRADAPCTAGGRWLTLPERIAVLAQHAAAARAEDRELLDAMERRCRELSIVLSNHLGGGSEWFSQVGDQFYADPKICDAELQRRKTDAHITKKALVRANRAAAIRAGASA